MTDVYIAQAVQALRDMHAPLLRIERAGITIGDFLSQQADTILSEHGLGNRATAFHLGSWCPGLVGLGQDQIMNATLSLCQARETIALEYGFSNWTQVCHLRQTMYNRRFEQAVELVIGGELDALQTVLAETPMLATQRSQYGHRSTLLHYLGANGVESHRQVTPFNAADIARCLIEAGSDVNSSANMYGGGSTVLGLLMSSAHPRAAGVRDSVAAVLTAAGAH